jgi:hypothetical protein
VYVSRDTISASRLSHHLCDLGMLGGGEHQTLNNGPLMPIVVKVGQGALRSSICSLTGIVISAFQSLNVAAKIEHDSLAGSCRDKQTR